VLNGNLEALRPTIEAGTLSRSAAANRGVTLSAVSKALKKGSENREVGTRAAPRIADTQ